MASPGMELKAARHILGWNHGEMARALRLVGDPEKLAARVKSMEEGRREVSGPVSVAVEAFLSGWRPGDWEPDP